MKKSILFIADTSIANPILHSQGFPLLKRLGEEGHTCILISFENDGANEEQKAFVARLLSESSSKATLVPVHYRVTMLLPTWIKLYFKGLYTASKIVFSQNIRVVHARSFIPAMIAATIKAFLNSRVQMLYDYRGVFIEEQVYVGHWKSGGLQEKLARLVEFFAVFNADAIVAVSKPMKQYLKEHYHDKVKQVEEKIHVIANKTVVPPPQATSNSVRHWSKTVGVYSGSAVRWQSLDQIRDLIQTGVEGFGDISFWILTYQDRTSFVHSLGTNPRLLNRVQIMTPGPGEVGKYLSRCHFGILIREDHVVNTVACPLKFAEYLSHGLPVLLSERIGDTEEIATKHGVGVILRGKNFSNALREMKELLKVPDIRDRCIETARKEFNIEDGIRDYFSIYSHGDLRQTPQPVHGIPDV